MEKISEFALAALPLILVGLALALFIAAWNIRSKEESLLDGQKLMRSGWAYLLAGLLCMALGYLVGKAQPFEDQSYLQGVLNGMQIVLLLLGIYRLGLGLGHKNSENKKD